MHKFRKIIIKSYSICRAIYKIFNICSVPDKKVKDRCTLNELFFFQIKYFAEKITIPLPWNFEKLCGIRNVRLMVAIQDWQDQAPLIRFDRRK